LQRRFRRFVLTSRRIDIAGRLVDARLRGVRRADQLRLSFIGFLIKRDVGLRGGELGPAGGDGFRTGAVDALEIGRKRGG
jgi:hypothetical protein